MRNKRLLSLLIPLLSFVLCLCLFILIFFSGCTIKSRKEYGVFLGINKEQIDRLRDYHIVVIEPSEFQTDQIRALHREGKKVYGYLNVGAIEVYRPYFNRFKGNTLGQYKDWPDERWIDVSSPEWQRFIVNELGKKYAEMGFDGLFLDNTDVYHHYSTEDNFRGLCSIMKGLKGHNLSLIINGGDDFVLRCIDENRALSLFDGINQETVFTSIDFKNKSYGRQTKKETLYFKKYISRVKKFGLSVYLLEYGADGSLADDIESYCKENGFFWYNAKGLELN